MAKLIKLNQFDDDRGLLTVIESELSFEVKRVFYISGADGYIRGGHRHHKTIQALVCLNGSCIISNNDGKATPIQYFVLQYSANSFSKWVTFSPNTNHPLSSILSNFSLYNFLNGWFNLAKFSYSTFIGFINIVIHIIHCRSYNQ